MEYLNMMRGGERELGGRGGEGMVYIRRKWRLRGPRGTCRISENRGLSTMYERREEKEGNK